MLCEECQTRPGKLRVIPQPEGMTYNLVLCNECFMEEQGKVIEQMRERIKRTEPKGETNENY